MYMHVYMMCRFGDIKEKIRILYLHKEGVKIRGILGESRA
jgi:hypothetical protein